MFIVEDLKEGIVLNFPFSQFNFVIFSISILFFSFTHTLSMCFVFLLLLGPFLLLKIKNKNFLVPLELIMEELPLAWGE
jgi:hypothetical protein